MTIYANSLNVDATANTIPVGDGTKFVGKDLSSTTPISITPYIVLTTDQVILVDTATITATCGVTLPSSGLANGQEFTVKDWSGAAPTYNIQVNVNGGLDMDGVNTVTLDQAYQAVTFVWDGALTKYSIKSEFTPGSSSTTMNVQTFTSSGTFTPSPGLRFCTIECVGAGGGGGGSQSSLSVSLGSSAGGGGGGGYARLTASAATIGASQTVTIGAGGTAGVQGTSNGGTGGTTSVGTLCVSTGGAGSLSVGSSAGQATSLGGNGGVGTAGDLLVNGSSGTPGISNGVAGFAYCGAGGSSYFAGQSNINVGAASGINGNAHGGGASGGSSIGINSAFDGGVGGNGYVIITEYI